MCVTTVVDESKIMYSGAGRIHRLVMRPMSLYESGEYNEKISIMVLFNNPNLDIDSIKSDLTIEELIFVACRGGWPASLAKISEHGQLSVVCSYLDNICNNYLK